MKKGAGTRTCIWGMGISWVQVQVGVKIPMGYPCHTLKSPDRFPTGRGLSRGRAWASWSLWARLRLQFWKADAAKSQALPMAFRPSRAGTTLGWRVRFPVSRRELEIWMSYWMTFSKSMIIINNCLESQLSIVNFTDCVYICTIFIVNTCLLFKFIIPLLSNV